MFFLQLRQLMWKNYLVRSRSKIRLAAEILWPLTIFLILALVRLTGVNNLKQFKNECFLEEKALPSAGLFTHIQSIICTSGTQCYETPPPPPHINITTRYEEVLAELNDILRIASSVSVYHQETSGPNTETETSAFDCEQLNYPESNVTQPAELDRNLLSQLLLSKLQDLENIKELYGKYTEAYWSESLDTTKLSVFQESETISIVESLSATFQKLADTPVGRVATLLGTAETSNIDDPSRIGQVFQALCGKPFMLPNSSSTTYDGDVSSVPNSRGRKHDYPQINVTPRDDSGLSEKCSSVFASWQNNTIAQSAFVTLYPYIRGKLVYAPNTTAFNQVVQKVNETFQELQKVQNASQIWLDTISPNVMEVLQVLEVALNNATEMVNKTCSHLLLPDNACNKTLETLIKASETVYKIQTVVLGLDTVANYTNYLIDCYEFNKFEGFATEEEAVSYGIKLLSQDQLWAVIIFEGDGSNSSDELPAHTIYKIRMDKNKVDNTQYIKDYTEVPYPRNDPVDSMKYFTSGFIYLQDKIEQAIIQIQAKHENLPLPEMYTAQTPTPCFVFDVFLFGMGPSYPLYMNLAFVFACAMIVKSIVYEKEKRLKETMRTMGLGNAVHWVAWFIDSMLVLTLVCIILPLLLYFGKVLENSNPFILFIFLFSFCLANVTFSFLISTLFSKANLAAACGAFIYFICYQPYNLIDYYDKNLSLSTNILSSLILNVAFGLGNAYVIVHEESGEGVQWSNIATSPIEGDPYSLLLCIVMQFVDAVIYMLMALYIEAVFPGDYGIPKPWYFLFQPSFWCPDKDKRYLYSDPSTDSGTPRNSDLIEVESTSLPVGVSIHNLGKTYSNGKQAVKSLSLDFYQNQITSFLGHNGAGKTTTISILTGLFPPSSGTATISGLDIRYQIDEIRQQLGLCPQHNVLFDQLTVVEHLLFYGNLKRGEQVESRKEIDQMIEDLGLSHKRNDMSIHLSGGMKRKLSIGSAFIGNSKTVILDEPTAGVDPYSRRSIWEILLKYKEGRTIILTTHFMDEADILGDRIAIISQGQLKCCGTSLFLKKKLGSGYYLTLVRKEETSGEPESNVDAESMSSKNALIDNVLKQHIPNCVTVQDVGTDRVVCLPEFDDDGLSQREKFPELFQDLESKIVQLGLDSYGVSDTTLEEIFLKVAEDPADADVNNLPGTESEDDRSAESGSDIFSLVSSEKLTGAALVGQQLLALYFKRFCNSKRNLKGFFCEIILPALLLIIGELFASTLNMNAPPPPLTLTPWLYGDSNVAFYANRNPSSTFANEYITNMLNETGMGVRCLTDDPIGYGNCSTAQLGLLNPEAHPEEYKDIQCPCELGVPHCPDDVNQGELWKFGSVTTDQFYDLSANDVNLWIVRTHEEFKPFRFGGFEFGVHSSIPSDSNIKVWYENKAWASSVAYLNAINNVLLRSSLPKTADPYKYGITAVNHPLDFSNLQVQNYIQAGVSVAFAITVIFSLSFVPASFVIFLVEERVSKAKHLQFVAGVKPVTFWTASYTWDMVNYVIPCIILLLIFLAFGQWEYVGSTSIGGMSLLLFLFGVAAIPLMYPSSFLFSVPSTAFVGLACANLFIGVVTTITSTVLQYFDDPKLEAVGLVLDKVFLIFPHFCLGRGMIDIAYEYYKIQSYQMIGISYGRSFFEWGYLGRYYCSLIIQAIIFFTFNLMLHYQVFPDLTKRYYQKMIPSSLGEEDEDVAKERTRVEEDRESSDELRLLRLTKVYSKGKKPATDRLSFGLRKGECFGLLGVNGAGKSTTFKMLTGDETVTSGNAFINQFSILSQLSKAQQNLGYCPQEDALLPLLTGTEHLQLFARLRGVPKRYIRKIVHDNLKKLGLLPYKNRNAGTYSGGNKRKLATAIALIGNPAVVFLDEPSSGMDPRARRSLWQSIIDAVKDSRSVLLTSHSMEECQVLCTRLAIMVNGTLRCLGSAQHLKNRFGDGYMINVRCEVNTAGEILQSVQRTIPEARLREQRPRQLVWHVPPNVLPISALFGRMEAVRKTTNMVDYSITQTTLDDVFVRFARLQREVDDDIPDPDSGSSSSSDDDFRRNSQLFTAL